MTEDNELELDVVEEEGRVEGLGQRPPHVQLERLPGLTARQKLHFEWAAAWCLPTLVLLGVFLVIVFVWLLPVLPHEHTCYWVSVQHTSTWCARINANSCRCVGCYSAITCSDLEASNSSALCCGDNCSQSIGDGNEVTLVSQCKTVYGWCYDYLLQYAVDEAPSQTSDSNTIRSLAVKCPVDDELCRIAWDHRIASTSTTCFMYDAANGDDVYFSNPGNKGDNRFAAALVFCVIFGSATLSVFAFVVIHCIHCCHGFRSA